MIQKTLMQELPLQTVTARSKNMKTHSRRYLAALKYTEPDDALYIKIGNTYKYLGDGKTPLAYYYESTRSESK